MRIIGSNLTLVSERIERDPTRGFFTVRVYEGTLGAVWGLINRLSVNEAYSVDNSEAPKYVATVRSPDRLDGSDTGLDFVDTWELLGNEIEKDLLSHPKAVALGDDVLEDIQKKVENRNAAVIIPAGDATTIYQMLLRGQTKFADSEWVLRHTRTVTNSGQLTVGFANVNRLLTTQQVNANEAVPSGLLFSISQIPVPDSIPSGYVWRWLKKPPTVSLAIGGKYQISQEWWLDLWPPFLYPLAV